MPGFCSGQALIGRLHSGFNDYAQEEKVNKRLLIGVQVLLRTPEYISSAWWGLCSGYRGFFGVVLGSI